MMNETISFIRTVLPETGDYYLTSKKRDLKGMFHQRVNHLNIAEYLEGFNKYNLENERCSYISFATYDEMPNKFRTEALFVKSKVLFIDIDIDADSDINSVLAEFKSKCQLELHTVIKSGGGIHALVMLESELEADAYRNINDLFQSYVASISLYNAIIDRQPMTACIRLPNSYNFKQSANPRLVSIIEQSNKAYNIQELTNFLNNYLDNNNIKKKVSAKKSEGVNGGEPLLFNNEGNIFGEVTGLQASDIVKNCGQILQQSNAKEFDWVGMINTLMPLDNAYETIHMLSKKHPTYTHEETDNKILSQISINASPRKCTTFEMNRPSICHTCEFYGNTNKEGESISPISLAYRFKELRENKERLTQKKTVKISEGNTSPALIKPLKQAVIKEVFADDDTDDTDVEEFTHSMFSIDKNIKSPSFGVMTYEAVKVGKQVTMQEVHLYDFIPIRGIQLITDMYKGVRPIVFQITFQDKRGREIVAELAAMDCSGTKYVEVLNNVGITYKSGKKQACMQFLEALVDYYRSTTFPVEATEKLGFDSTRSYFALGDRIYSKDKDIRVEPRGEVAQYMIDTRASGKDGAIKAWRDCVQMYSHKGMEWCQSVIAASVAAPLLTFVNLGGSCAVSLYGDSGNGKSTLQRLCTAIWGKPQKLIASGVDTNAAGFLKMGKLNSIPLHFDEMTTLTAKQIGLFAYQVTQGRAKDASTDKGTLRHNPSKFCSLVTLSTNMSIQNALANDKESFAAQRKRILELTTTPIAHLNPLTSAEVNMRINALEIKHGDVGHHLIRHFMNNLDFYEKKIYEIHKWVDDNAKIYGYNSTDRFLTQYLILMIIGCDIGIEQGLFDFDKRAITNFVIKEIVRVSKSIEADEIQNKSHTNGDHYREFIHQHDDSVLIVNAPSFETYKAVASVAGNVPSMTSDIVYIQREPVRKKVLVRAERLVNSGADLVKNNFVYYISLKDFKKYCNEHSLDLGMINAGVKDVGGSIEVVKRDMWLGTSRSANNLVECYRVYLPPTKDKR